MSIEGLKIVTAQEMARIEKRAVGRGGDEERFMDEAGRKVALAAMEYVEKHGLVRRIALLVGKGNNGGDAWAAGIYLLDEGFQVRAVPLYKMEEGSALNRKFGERFKKKKGRIEPKEIHFEEDGLILDGLLGTGFKGNVEPAMGAVIQRAVDSGKPILAIDIPSGLNGTTGEAGNYVIVAQETITLGLPKIGFFLRQGWNCVGQLRVENFGLLQEDFEEANAVAYLPNWKHLRLPQIVRTRHKYQSGFVVGFAGSTEFSGAAKMASRAALRAGAGIVRLFYPEKIGPAFDELICGEWNVKEWKEAMARAQSLFIGPGLGKSKETHRWLQTYMKGIKQPCVVDADALLPDLQYPALSILTPHRGEALRILGLKQVPEEEEDLFSKVMRFCERKQTVVVLKGAPTFIFAPGKAPIVITHGDPGMATAGTGDVLTGILAALLAQGMFCYEAAILGTILHGIAGEEAAKEKTSYCVIASDLIECLPKAFQIVMKWRDIA